MLRTRKKWKLNWIFNKRAPRKKENPVKRKKGKESLPFQRNRKNHIKSKNLPSLLNLRDREIYQDHLFLHSLNLPNHQEDLLKLQNLLWPQNPQGDHQRHQNSHSRQNHQEDHQKHQNLLSRLSHQEDLQDLENLGHLENSQYRHSVLQNHWNLKNQESLVNPNV